MEEEQEPPSEDELRAEAETFRQTLRDRGVESLSCPACGESERFGGFNTLALNVISDRMNVDPGPIGHGSIHAFTYTCGRCGFVSLFDHHVLDS